MQKNTLFRKYFTLFSFTAVSSILILGVILLAFATQYFQDEKYALLERNARQAAAVTEMNYAGNHYESIDRNLVMVAYTVLSATVDAEIFLVDLDGNILLASGPVSGGLVGERVSPEAVQQTLEFGKHTVTSTLSDLFAEPYYTVSVPLYVRGQPAGAVFAATSAKGLTDFLGELGKMFLISALVVLFVSTVVIYAVTMRLIRPLKDMLYATQSFSAGDFSKRVPVGSYDEIGQLAMAFNNMASTLSTTEQTRRSFVANVSHELKTPMTTIGGFVDGMLDGTVPEEKREQYLQIVSNEVKRLSRLVHSMLDTARIEAGEMQMNPVSFDISETIRQTIFTFEHSIEEKGLEIRGLDTERVFVQADKDLMHQVIYNLVENAVKFVNQGGYIEVRYQDDGQRTYVAIRNSGQGIDRDEVPQLFERFYKSDKSRSLNKNGVGLGLHIVRSIIGYHKGEIVVRSTEGEFTEFEFYIPNPPKTTSKPGKPK